MMTQQELFSKNLILSTEFDRYVLEHPEFAQEIPANAQVVLLPADDPELRQKNLELAKAQREPGQPVIYVEIESFSLGSDRANTLKINIKQQK